MQHHPTTDKSAEVISQPLTLRRQRHWSLM
jgi:hypothetical protein